MFQKLGARLSEPVDEDRFGTGEGEPSQSNRAVSSTVIRVFILSRDPLAIECIVSGTLPFFRTLAGCRFCDNAKLKFFSSKTELANALRELPLGHHIHVQIGNGKDLKSS